MMQDDLLQLVCATYNNAMMGEQDPDVAFARTVKMVQRRRPLLTRDGAHRVVSQILALERQVGQMH
jgi:hypothetical protein